MFWQPQEGHRHWVKRIYRFWSGYVAVSSLALCDHVAVHESTRGIARVRRGRSHTGQNYASYINWSVKGVAIDLHCVTVDDSTRGIATYMYRIWGVVRCTHYPALNYSWRIQPCIWFFLQLCNRFQNMHYWRNRWPKQSPPRDHLHLLLQLLPLLSRLPHLFPLLLRHPQSHPHHCTTRLRTYLEHQ